jgi:hypothetical protein
MGRSRSRRSLHLRLRRLSSICPSRRRIGARDGEPTDRGSGSRLPSACGDSLGLVPGIPCSSGAGGVGSINSDAQNVPSFRRWGFKMKVSPWIRCVRTVTGVVVRPSISSSLPRKRKNEEKKSSRFMETGTALSICRIGMNGCNWFCQGGRNGNQLGIYDVHLSNARLAMQAWTRQQPSRLFHPHEALGHGKARFRFLSSIVSEAGHGRN